MIQADNPRGGFWREWGPAFAAVAFFEVVSYFSPILALALAALTLVGILGFLYGAGSEIQKRDSGSKPLVETEGLDAKHESRGAGTAIAQPLVSGDQS